MDFVNGQFVARTFTVCSVRKELVEGRTYTFTILYNGVKVGTFKFTTMPGNPGVVVSHALEFLQKYRGKGLARDAQRLREHVARDLGFNAMIATVVVTNFPEVVSAANAGWKLGETFRNEGGTKNLTAFMTKILTP